MSAVETLLPEVIAAEPEAAAEPAVVVQGPVHIHPIRVGGQNAHASLRTDNLGNRLDFHAHANSSNVFGVTTKSSWSEAAIAIPVKTTGQTTARVAQVKLFCGWLGIAHHAEKGGLVSGSRGRWRAGIEAGLCKASDVTHPLIKNRLLAKAGGGWEVEPSTGDAAVTLVDFDHLPAADRSYLVELDRAFRDIEKPFNALTADLKTRWLGTVTFPAVTLEPDTDYEIFLKGKSEGLAKAQGIFASAFAYVDFNPGLIHPDLNDAAVRRDYGLFLNAAEIKWRQPGVELFTTNGDLINGWYWLRKEGARADWVFKDVEGGRVKTHLWATLKPLVVTTYDGTPTYTDVNTSITGKERVEDNKPTRFAVPKDKVTAHGRVSISITWRGEDVDGDGLEEHVAVNAQALTLDYD